ncbi:hypothetical protein ACIGD1_34150 [Streptomyces sp. NPDC085612]|uniref:hypothetical protein n=1 Tax=Streptomyces sp. NPDC085612 TaxID=3365732 RepID=UPI0037CE83D6
MVEQFVAEFLEHHAHGVAALVDVLETLLDAVRLVAQGLVQTLLVHRMAWRVFDLHPGILSAAADSAVPMGRLPSVTRLRPRPGGPVARC